VVAEVREPVDAVRAEDVRDLVWIRDDRRRSERQDEPSELVHEELRRFQVHVRVDEPGDDPAIRGVDLLSPLVVTEPGDVPVDDRDVGVEPLAREGAEDAAATDDDVGRLVAARDGQTSLEALHGRVTY
jgi:hypothetical protein